MSTSSTAALPAPVAQIAAQPAVATDGRVAIGDGLGAKQVVVETWKNTPYVFMVNTNNDLFFGHMTTWQSNVAPWNSYSVFSGWTFLADSTETIAVDVWRSAPFIYRVDSRNDLYYGHLSTVVSNTPPWTGQDVFSGWGLLATDAKEITVGQWYGGDFLFMTTTNTNVYYGELYTVDGAPSPPSPGQTRFGGWNYLTTAAKSVSVDFWRGALYVYLINDWDDLYYGNLYFDPNYVPPPGGAPKVDFSGWTGVVGGAKSVVVSQWNSTPYLYLITTQNMAYQATLTPLSSSSTVPPGPSQLSDWSYFATAAKSIAVGQWGGRPILYVVNFNNDLYYRYWYTVRTEVARWTYADVPVQTDWTFLIGAANQVVTGSWQNNPYVFLTNTKNNLYQGHFSLAVSNSAPWNSYVAFSGWAAL